MTVKDKSTRPPMHFSRNHHKSDDAKKCCSVFFQRFEYLLNILNQLIIGFITIFMFWICLHNRLEHTALHAFLMTIGFSFIMAEGIMCHYENNLLTSGLSRKSRGLLHSFLQILGGGCGLAGGIIKIEQNHFPLTSLHSRLGFATLIICFTTLLTGFLTFYFYSLRGITRPLFMRLVHNFLGIATFTLALVTQSYGYHYHLISLMEPIDFVIVLRVLTLVSLVLTCIGPLKAFFCKLALICQSK